MIINLWYAIVKPFKYSYLSSIILKKLCFCEPVLTKKLVSDIAWLQCQHTPLCVQHFICHW